MLVLLAASGITCRLDKLIRPVTADRLVVSPDSLVVSANAGSNEAASRFLLIVSGDGATLPWNATKRAAWLTLSRTSGGAPDTIVLTLHADTLSQAVRYDTIVFTSAAAPDTVRVPVTFDVLAPAPELSVSPAASMDSAFAGSAVARAFVVYIDNTGALPLTWSAVTSDAWLTLSRSSGGAPPRDSTIVTLTAATLAAGTHTGTVTITAPGAIGSPESVTVIFTLKPCDEPTVVPDTVVSGAIALSDCGARHRTGSQARRYSVTANAGDTLSLRLSSPDFDAYLTLADSLGAALAQNDDCPAATGPACILNVRAPAPGRYVIEATTAAPGATGTFSLSVVRERAPSVPQSPGQFRGDSVTAIAVGSATPASEVVFKATVNDPNARDSVRLEVEAVETSSPFSGTPNHSSAYVAAGQTAWIRATGLTENARYHWRARTCDTTARCSAWLSFGSNLDGAPDFLINAIPEDPALDGISLNQFSGAASIPVGGGTGGGLGSSQTVTFRAAVTDADPGDVIVLEVESKATNAAFDGTSDLYRGAGVTSGNTAAAAAAYTVALLAANYHWRARACDQTGRCSAWRAFGGNSDTVGPLNPADTDFHVP